MTRKQFAAIMQSKTVAKEITETVKANLHVTRAGKGIAAIQEIASKYSNDFGAVDPSWSPDGSKKKNMSKKCFACIMSAKELAVAITEKCEIATANKRQGVAMLKEILALAEKFTADFGAVDPSWKNTNTAKTEEVAVTETVEPVQMVANGDVIVEQEVSNEDTLL